MYKTLFEVRILHHFFLDMGEVLFDNLDQKQKSFVLKNYDISNFLTITPTEVCAAFLRKHRCIFRQTATGFIVGTDCIQTNSKYFPEIKFNEGLYFTFAIRFADPNFLNYTSLPLIKNNNQKYYIHNLPIGSKTFPYITLFAPIFEAGLGYSAGDILTNSNSTPTQLYIASKTSNIAPPSSNWINDKLVNGAPIHYLNKADLTEVYSDYIEYRTGKKLSNLSVSLKSRGNDELEPKFETFEENDETVVKVRLNNYPENYYTIKFSDSSIPYSKEFPFYLFQKGTNHDCIVEITVSKGSTSYHILDANGALTNPTFQLRFKNRYTFWRFMGAKFSNKPETGPHPLTKYGQVTVTVPDCNNQNTDELPNPSGGMIKIERPDPTKNEYNTVSEIYVN